MELREIFRNRKTVYFFFDFAHSLRRLSRSFSTQYCCDLRYIFTAAVYFTDRVPQTLGQTLSRKL